MSPSQHINIRVPNILVEALQIAYGREAWPGESRSHFLGRMLARGLHVEESELPPGKTRDDPRQWFKTEKGEMK